MSRTLTPMPNATVETSARTCTQREFAYSTERPLPAPDWPPYGVDGRVLAPTNSSSSGAIRSTRRESGSNTARARRRTRTMSRAGASCRRRGRRGRSTRRNPHPATRIFTGHDSHSDTASQIRAIQSRAMSTTARIGVIHAVRSAPVARRRSSRTRRAASRRSVRAPTRTRQTRTY